MLAELGDHPAIWAHQYRHHILIYSFKHPRFELTRGDNFYGIRGNQCWHIPIDHSCAAAAHLSSGLVELRVSECCQGRCVLLVELPTNILIL